jgi:hypothetical protein
VSLHVRKCLPAASAILLAALLTACSTAPMGSTAGTITGTPSTAALSGNWQISTDATEAAPLPQLSGSLTGAGSAVSGIFHPATSNACINPQSKIAVSGSLDEHSVLTLSSAPFAGGSVLKLTGTVISGNRLQVSTYSVTGGACAFSAGANSISATAHLLQPVSGTYAGSFTDSDGATFPITATLTQTTQPDSNGVFHVSGGATFDNNQRVSSPIVADSTVTGNTLSATYTQQGNTIVATGTFDDSATTLTITNWTLDGPCGTPAPQTPLNRIADAS